MPAELLQFPPAYVIVGVYRLFSDGSLIVPVLQARRQTAKSAVKGAIFAIAWVCVSMPFTRLYVKFFMRTAMFSSPSHSTWFGINVFTYTTWLLLLQQASMVLEYFVERELRLARAHAYEATVKSRGKDLTFWQPYVEEWQEPPAARAKRSMQRKGFLAYANNRILRILVNKIMLSPLNFIPFLGIGISAALSSVNMARILHRPFFLAKKMTPEQEELFIVERLIEYRSFGFAAAILERLPVVGLIFSIANRVGAAMWAHDLEKRQHAYSSGEIKPTKQYVSKTASIESELPHDFAGGFPSRKGPVRMDGDDVVAAAGGEALESDPAGPRSPARSPGDMTKGPPLRPR